MRIRLRFLRDARVIEEMLENDGWKLEREQESVSAKHPDISDEASARSRLHELGLLTSGSLHIEFHKLQSVLQMVSSRRSSR